MRACTLSQTKCLQLSLWSRGRPYPPEETTAGHCNNQTAPIPTDVQNKVPQSAVERRFGCISVLPFRDTTQPAQFSTDRSAARYAMERHKTTNALHICLRNGWRTMMYKESARQMCRTKCHRVRWNVDLAAYLFCHSAIQRSQPGSAPTDLQRDMPWNNAEPRMHLHICFGKVLTDVKMYVGSALQMCTPKRRRLRQSHFDLFSDTGHQSYLTQSHANGWKNRKTIFKNEKHDTREKESSRK